MQKPSGLKLVVRRRGDRVKWLLLLNTLVSRQGGGTIVSLTEDRFVLEKRAQQQGLDGDLQDAFLKLTDGPTPLLRGDPDKDATRFSLKHDVLAVVLSRWNDEHDGAVNAHKEEAAQRRLMLGISIILFIAAACVSFLAYDRGEAAVNAKRAAIGLMQGYARRAPTGSFRQSLVLSILNLDQSSKPSDFYEAFFQRLHQRDQTWVADIENTFRDVVFRSPWFVSSGIAVGVNPAANRLAILREKGLDLVTFSSDKLEPPQIESRDLQMRIGGTLQQPAVGFVDDLGPVAFDGSAIYFWDEDGKPQSRDLWMRLPLQMRTTGFAFVEIHDGKLLIWRIVTDENGLRDSVLELGAAELRSDPIVIDESRIREIGSRAPNGPKPIVSAPAHGHPLYGFLERKGRELGKIPESLPAESDLIGKEGPPWTPLELTYGLLDSSSNSKDEIIAAIPVPATGDEVDSGQTGVTFTFIPGRSAIAFKLNEPGFYVETLGDNPTMSLPTHVDVEWPAPPVQRFELLAHSPGLAWYYPPFAVAQVGRHWRAAWLGSDHIMAVKSSDLDPSVAKPFSEWGLLSGELRGTRLQFTLDGSFLVAQQQFDWRGPVRVRVWNLSSAHREWVANADVKDLRKQACRVLAEDTSTSNRDRRISFAEEFPMFPPQFAQFEPCPLLRQDVKEKGKRNDHGE